MLQSGQGSEIRAGNALPLRYIPVGTTVHNVELKPGAGGKIGPRRRRGDPARRQGRPVRDAAAARPPRCAACRSTAAPPSARSATARPALISIGKAGRNRWKGKRPHVRGVAMNPVDHPLGGGEGKSSGGRHPVSPWGKPEGRTRKKGKKSDELIIRRRRAPRRTEVIDMPRSLKKGPFVDDHLAEEGRRDERGRRPQGHQDVVAPLAPSRPTWSVTRSRCTTAASTCRCTSPRRWSVTSSASSRPPARSGTTPDKSDRAGADGTTTIDPRRARDACATSTSRRTRSARCSTLVRGLPVDDAERVAAALREGRGRRRAEAARLGDRQRRAQRQASRPTSCSSRARAPTKARREARPPACARPVLPDPQAHDAHHDRARALRRRRARARRRPRTRRPVAGAAVAQRRRGRARAPFASRARPKTRPRARHDTKNVDEVDEVEADAEIEATESRDVDVDEPERSTAESRRGPRPTTTPSREARRRSSNGTEGQPVRVPSRHHHRLEVAVDRRARRSTATSSSRTGRSATTCASSSSAPRSAASRSSAPRDRLRIDVYTARPGIVIGRRGAEADRLREGCARSPATRRSSSTSRRSSSPSSTPRCSRRVSPTSSPAACRSGAR